MSLPDRNFKGHEEIHLVPFTILIVVKVRVEIKPPLAGSWGNYDEKISSTNLKTIALLC